MDTYLIIGLVVLAFLAILFLMKGRSSKQNKASTEWDSSDKEPSEEDLIKMENELQKIISYKLEDEEAIFAKLPQMSDEEMAKYADKVTLKHYNDDQFLSTQIPEDIIDKLKEAPWDDQDARFMLLNPTVFGNSAYIALNAKEPYANRAKLALNFLKSKL